MSERHLLPPNATAQERNLSLATARLADIAVPIASLWRANECPSALLPWLAWAMSVEEEWSLCRTDADRRALIADAVALHRHKGTPGGIEAALSRAGFASARVIERLQTHELPASRHDGRFRRTGAIVHDGKTARPDRTWAIFGVTLDADDQARARSRFADLKALIDTYKRACCHLAWLKPEQRLSDLVPQPWEGQQVKAKTGLRDRLLKGPFHDGAHRRGFCQRPLHDGVHARNAALRYDNRPLATRGAEIAYGRPQVSDRLTLSIRHAWVERTKGRSTHNGLSSYHGFARHNGQRAIPGETLALIYNPTLAQGRFAPDDPVPAAIVTGGDFSNPAKDFIFGGRF